MQWSQGQETPRGLEDGNSYGFGVSTKGSVCPYLLITTLVGIADLGASFLILLQHRLSDALVTLY